VPDPPATTRSFYVTVDPPDAATRAGLAPLLAAVAARDAGTFWAAPGVTRLTGFRQLAGDVPLPPPSPLPTTLAFLAFVALAVVGATRPGDPAP
jgi:hypothetical protein